MSRPSLHIQITAHDRPGILAETLAFVVKFGWNVMDIKQFVFNGMLNLSILLHEDNGGLISPLKESLAKYAEERGYKVTICPWKMESNSEISYPHRSVVTLLFPPFLQQLFWK